MEEVETVASSLEAREEVSQPVGVVPSGCYLWKFPSEGSNRVESSHFNTFSAISINQEYPRKCHQCGVCWVSNHDFELQHLQH